MLSRLLLTYFKSSAVFERKLFTFFSLSNVRPGHYFRKVKVSAFADDEVVVFEDTSEVAHNVGVHPQCKYTYLAIAPSLKHTYTHKRKFLSAKTF